MTSGSAEESRHQQNELITALGEVGSTSPVTHGERLLDRICEYTLRSSLLDDLVLSLVDTAAARILDVRRCDRPVNARSGRVNVERIWEARRVTAHQPYPDVDTWLFWNSREAVLITDRESAGESLDLLRVVNDTSPILQEIVENPVAAVRGTGDVRFVMPLTRLDDRDTYAPVAFLDGRLRVEDLDAHVEWFWRFATTLAEVSATQIARYLKGPFRHRPPEDLHLSTRETEVLAGIGDGLSADEIAARMSISAGTVKTYRSRIRQKTGLHTEAALVKLAIRLRLTRP